MRHDPSVDGQPAVGTNDSGARGGSVPGRDGGQPLHHWLSLVAVFVIAVLVHVEALGYWFVTTDTLPLIATSRVGGVADLVGLFVHPLMHGSSFVSIALFYRPIASLSFAFDYALWGLDPAGYHATNLVLHGLVAVMAAVAIIELTGRPRAGYLGALLFSIHPLTVEAVPATARRHDLLMSVFFLAALTLFVRSRDTGSTRRLGLALVGYGLALGSKETAILLPALLFVWVLLRRWPDATFGAGYQAVRAVVPFAVVTAGYLALRISVLGGLGGYHKENPLSVTEVVAVPVKHLLWVSHPVNVLDIAHAVRLSGWLAAAVAIGITGSVLLGVRRLDQPRSIGAVTLLGFGLVSVLVAAPAVGPQFPGGRSDAVFHYVAGIVFVGSCAAGVLSASLASDVRFGPLVGRQVTFFGVWVLLPIGLFMMSNNLTLRPYVFGHSSHNSYLFIVPAMALPSVLAVEAARELDLRRGVPKPDANAAVVVLVGLFLLPILVTTPLVHPYDGWEASGRVNEETLEGVSRSVEPVPDGTTVVIEGLPQNVRSQRHAFPRVKSITPMRRHTVAAWLELEAPNRDLRVEVADTRPVPHAESSISVERTGSRGNAVRLAVSIDPA